MLIPHSQRPTQRHCQPMCALMAARQEHRRRSTDDPRRTEPLSFAQEGYCVLVGTGDDVNCSQKVWQLGGMGGSGKEERRLGQWWLLGDRKCLMIGERETRDCCLVGSRNQNLLLLQKSGVNGDGTACAIVEAAQLLKTTLYLSIPATYLLGTSDQHIASFSVLIRKG